MIEASWPLFIVASLVLIATPGLGAILRASELLFIALKLVGAAYLIYLGVGLLRTRAGELVVKASMLRPPSRLFVDGVLSNISNPKIAIFYFAFLPQFVPPGATNPTASIFVLGLAFAALTFLMKALIGLSAGALSGWLRERPGVLTWMFRTSGAILVGLGARLALERR